VNRWRSPMLHNERWSLHREERAETDFIACAAAAAIADTISAIHQSEGRIEPLHWRSSI
jgi:hypothetical protein